MVMRITREQGTRSQATLKIEGTVTGEWAALMERECQNLLHSCDAVGLDLREVTFVDRAGLETLERLSRAGVEICCRFGVVASVLEAEGVRVTRVSNGVDDGLP
ncbi:MAG: hypothetical protein ACREAA_19940 [Candidatus Polarisedimenticolia bacterium]